MQIKFIVRFYHKYLLIDLLQNVLQIIFFNKLIQLEFSNHYPNITYHNFICEISIRNALFFKRNIRKFRKEKFNWLKKIVYCIRNWFPFSIFFLIQYYYLILLLILRLILFRFSPKIIFFFFVLRRRFILSIIQLKITFLFLFSFYYSNVKMVFL